jgi:transposase
MARARSVLNDTDGDGRPDSMIITNDWASYKPLSRRYIDHQIINHSDGIYVRGSVYTNTIEGTFGNMKTGMRGVYTKVPPRYLQSYLDEYSWRHNAKRNDESLFEQLLDRATAVRHRQRPWDIQNC